MSGIVRFQVRTLYFVTLLTMLAACGGGSGTADSGDTPVGGNGGGNTPTPEVIEGVATPSSVSVVTATNAS